MGPLQAMTIAIAVALGGIGLRMATLRMPPRA
jgi:hypothetical protein